MKDNFKFEYRFYLNCPFCRKEAETLEDILQCDCVHFVNYSYISKCSFTAEA